MPLFNAIWENNIQTIYEASSQMLYEERKTWPNSSPNPNPNTCPHVYFHCKTAVFILEGLTNISLLSSIPSPKKKKGLNWILRFGGSSIWWKRSSPSLLWPISRTDWVLERGAARATVQAGILMLNLRNGCEKTFGGRRGFMQESTADAFENRASYCVFITCVSSSHNGSRWFIWGFPQKKKNKTNLSHTPYPRLGWSHIWHLCWQSN